MFQRRNVLLRWSSVIPGFLSDKRLGNRVVFSDLCVCVRVCVCADVKMMKELHRLASSRRSVAISTAAFILQLLLSNQLLPEVDAVLDYGECEKSSALIN